MNFLQLFLGCAEQSSEFGTDFFRLAFDDGVNFGQQIYLRGEAEDKLLLQVFRALVLPQTRQATLCVLFMRLQVLNVSRN